MLPSRMLHSEGNIVTTSFRASTLYGNMKTVNMAVETKLQMLLLTIFATKLMTRVLKRSCVLVNISWSHLNLKKRDKLFKNASDYLNAKLVGEKLDRVYSNLRCAAKMNLAVGCILKNIEGDTDYFTHTRTIPCWIDPNLCASRRT